MNQVSLKRFTSPDEARSFEKGSFEVVRLGGLTIPLDNTATTTPE